MNVISILLLIFIPILLKNKKTFPLVFILLNTNILELSYGSTTWVLYSFGGGVTGNIFLSYYVSITYIFLSINQLKNNPNYVITYKAVFGILFLLLLIGFLNSFYYGLQVQTLSRILRNFIRYPEYLYLAIYLFSSKENVIRFVKTLFFFLLVSFAIQLFEIVNQQRFIISFLAPPKNEWASYYFENIYVIIPGFGEVFYSWSRMHGFIPLAILLSFYFYLSRIKISGVFNILFIIIPLLSLFLSFSRIAMILTILIISLIIVVKIFTERRIGNREVFYFSIGAIIIFFISIQFQELFSAIYGRFLTIEDLRHGDDTALPRISVLQYQLKYFSEAILIGKGFSFKDSFFIINPDLGITNLLPIFGLIGMILPLTIITNSFYLIKKIKTFDEPFFIASFVVVVVFIIIFGIVQDVYLDKIFHIYPIFSIIEAKINNPNWPNEKKSELNS